MPLSAVEFRLTVQLSVPAEVIELLAQANPLNTGTPVPLKVIKVVEPEDELLVSVSAPVANPATVGSNYTVNSRRLIRDSK